jgi:glycosyltransferase involved in cell wall biosynthesis
VLAETDVLLVPSLWYENSPLVVQEAIAAGVPILASNLGALAEKVRPGVNGWLCPPGDIAAWRAQIRSLIEDPSWREQLRIEKARWLSLEDHMTALEAIYHSKMDSIGSS